MRYEWETFYDPSWLALYTGFDYLPTDYDPLADFFPVDVLREQLARMRGNIASIGGAVRPLTRSSLRAIVRCGIWA